MIEQKRIKSKMKRSPIQITMEELIYDTREKVSIEIEFELAYIHLQSKPKATALMIRR